MKPNRLFGLAAVGLCLLSGAAAHAQEPLAASYAAVQGIKIDFTPSPRTPHYRFELREKGGETLLCAKEFDSLPGRTNVFLPFDAALPGAQYTLSVTALPQTERAGLDTAATKERDFSLPTVCGHTLAQGGFLYGDGSEENPYLVASPAQLQHISHADHRGKGQYFRQTRDIDLLDPAFYQDGAPYDADADPSNGNWLPIAPAHNWNNTFIGHYGGGGHAVRNISYINSLTSNQDAGIFGIVSRNSSIHDLGVENFHFEGLGAGGIVGAASGWTTGMTTRFYRCYALNGYAKGANAGGCFGYLHSDTGNLQIEDCYCAGFTGEAVYSNGYNDAGGIASEISSNHTGQNWVRGCYAIPLSLSTNNTSARHGLGGVVGTVVHPSYVSYPSYADFVDVQGNYYLAGLAPYGVGYPASDSGAVPISSSSFGEQSTFSGWDFEGTWTMGSITYTDASGAERTIAAPVLRAFQGGRDYAAAQGAGERAALTLGFSK